VASDILISLPIYDRLRFGIDLNGIVIAADVYAAPEKLATSKRKQTLAPPLQPLCPLRSAWAQPDLSIEESDVGLVKGMFLNSRF
jgi:hypothetical protein